MVASARCPSAVLFASNQVDLCQTPEKSLTYQQFSCHTEK